MSDGKLQSDFNESSVNAEAPSGDISERVVPEDASLPKDNAAQDASITDADAAQDASIADIDAISPDASLPEEIAAVDAHISESNSDADSLNGSADSEENDNSEKTEAPTQEPKTEDVLSTENSRAPLSEGEAAVKDFEADEASPYQADADETDADTEDFAEEPLGDADEDAEGFDEETANEEEDGEDFAEEPLGDAVEDAEGFDEETADEEEYEEDFAEEPLDDAVEDAESFDEETADEEEDESKKIGNRFIDSLFDFIELFIFSLAAVFVITTFFFRHSVVDGTSMEQTLFHGEHIIISDLFYKPERGDIIVCEDYSTELPIPIVKRVIGIAGDRVEIDSYGNVKVNGVQLDESAYVYIDAPYYRYNSLDIIVPDGEIFVMGDHRNVSDDSRNLDKLGTIKEDSILGKVLFRFYPFEKFGKVE